MTSRRGTLWRNARKLSSAIDRAKLSVKEKLDRFEPLEILPYRSHGTHEELRVIGRVVEQKGVESTEGDASVLTNLANTVRRLESDEIPGARIRASYGGATSEQETDREGFFDIRLEPSGGVLSGWHEVKLTLLDSMAGGQGIEATAEIMVPPGEAEFGVVSDLDDTVIRTGATDRLTQLSITFSNAPEDRTPMPGGAPLYRALEAGPDRAGWNPFFYVSRSGWGLYDLFETFLDANEMPSGPILLQDIALVERKSEQIGSERHKRDEIDDIMDRHPDLPFVLIGDNGQEDPETYREIVRDRADRVRAVLIRDVTDPERDREVRRIIQDIVDEGVDAAAAESSISMARAAADFGLIAGETIEEVREAMVRDGV